MGGSWPQVEEEHTYSHTRGTHLARVTSGLGSTCAEVSAVLLHLGPAPSRFTAYSSRFPQSEHLG